MAGRSARHQASGGGAAASSTALAAGADVAQIGLEDLLQRLGSSAAGLSEADAEARLRRYGPNALPRPRPPHPLRLLLAQLVHTLALGVDPAERDAMERPPRTMKERMVTPALLWRALGYLGLWAAALSLAGFFYFQWDVTGSLFGHFVDEGPLYRQATTVTLAGIVACQVANAFACRSQRDSILRVGFLSNPVLLWAIGAEVGLLAALIGFAPLRQVFDLEPIEPRFWPVLAAFPPLFLAAEEARKWVVRRLSRRTPGGTALTPA